MGTIELGGEGEVVPVLKEVCRSVCKLWATSSPRPVPAYLDKLLEVLSRSIPTQLVKILIRKEKVAGQHHFVGPVDSPTHLPLLLPQPVFKLLCFQAVWHRGIVSASQ